MKSNQAHYSYVGRVRLRRPEPSIEELIAALHKEIEDAQEIIEAYAKTRQAQAAREAQADSESSTTT